MKRFKVGDVKYVVLGPSRATLAAAKAAYEDGRRRGVEKGMPAAEWHHRDLLLHDLFSERLRYGLDGPLKRIAQWQKALKAPGLPEGMREQLTALARRELELARALRLCWAEYERGSAESCGLDARAAFLAAACTVDDRHRVRAFRDAADFSERLGAGDPVALGAWRAVTDMEEAAR